MCHRLGLQRIINSLGVVAWNDRKSYDLKQQGRLEFYHTHFFLNINILFNYEVLENIVYLFQK